MKLNIHAARRAALLSAAGALAASAALAGGTPAIASPQAMHHPTVDHPVPSGRVWESWAYDPAQHDVVLFGGDGGHGAGSPGRAYGSTWTWNGSTWTKRHPAASPPPSDGAAMAWDPAMHKMLLFGGGTAPGTGHTRYFSDTWTWNGTTWTRLHPATSPPPKHQSDMFYDAALHEIILFGGNGNQGYDNQTWAWAGTTWTRLHPAHSPSPRDTDSLVYDPATRTAILYGGFNDVAGRLSDTWSFSGTTWTRLHPAHSPGVDSPVWQAAYDSASRQLILYGGDAGLGGPFSQSTWTWAGTTWTRLHPAATAGPRGYGAMTYDAVLRRIVLFGGGNNQNTDPRKVSEWNGTTWQTGKQQPGGNRTGSRA